MFSFFLSYILYIWLFSLLSHTFTFPCFFLTSSSASLSVLPGADAVRVLWNNFLQIYLIKVNINDFLEYVSSSALIMPTGKRSYKVVTLPFWHSILECMGGKPARQEGWTNVAYSWDKSVPDCLLFYFGESGWSTFT